MLLDLGLKTSAAAIAADVWQCESFRSHVTLTPSSSSCKGPSLPLYCPKIVWGNTSVKLGGKVEESQVSVCVCVSMQVSDSLGKFI